MRASATTVDVSALAPIAPRRTDRAFLVGMTGSGKTTLAQALLELRRYTVVLDVKGTLKWSGYRLYTTLRELTKAREPRLIYRPRYDELQNLDAMDAFFRWIWLRRRTTVYVDEVTGITRGSVIPYHYGACLTRGREWDIEVWSGTQRPHLIPQVVMSEAEHTYAFRLRMPQDRDRVEAFSGIPADTLSIQKLAKRRFYYSPESGDVRGPFMLALTR